METNSRNCTCVQCNMSFGRAAPVKTYTLTHSGVKTLTCSECKKSFGQAKDLSRHMITRTWEKAYKCAECGDLFAEARNLKRHFLNSPRRPCETPKIITSSRGPVGNLGGANNYHFLKKVIWDPPWEYPIRTECLRRYARLWELYSGPMILLPGLPTMGRLWALDDDDDRRCWC